MAIWQEQAVDSVLSSEMAAKLSCHQIVAQILLKRGYTEPQSLLHFLNPKLDDLHDPFLLKSMDLAIDRLGQALHQQESVVVFGDYDADGITSASLLILGLKALGISKVDFFVPHRLKHGYGLCKEGIDFALEQNASLLITCDCGITAIEEVAYAQQKGLDVIITDHHEAQDTLPDALAIVNPKQDHCAYPFQGLAGVGVVFKLLQALDVHREFLDILTVGTIADVVPLTGENRIIVSHGIPAMRRSSNLGIQSLLEVCELQNKKFGAGDVAFRVAPRINAIGRLGDPSDGIRMLTTNDSQEAKEIALRLDQENQKRKDIEQAIVEQAIAQVEKRMAFQQEKVLVLYDSSWHVGVVGIVASRIVEKYHKPTIILAGIDEQQEGFDPHVEKAKGSCRSIPALNMFEALNACSELLLGFGGHAYAAGLSIELDNLGEFRKSINAYAQNILEDKDMQAHIAVDALVPFEQVSMDLYEALETMAPFGAQNPRPNLRSNGVQLASMPRVVGQKHMQCAFKSQAKGVSGIAFQMAERFEEFCRLFKEKALVDIVYQLSINEWQGQKTLQIQLKDLQASY